MSGPRLEARRGKAGRDFRVHFASRILLARVLVPLYNRSRIAPQITLKCRDSAESLLSTPLLVEFGAHFILIPLAGPYPSKCPSPSNIMATEEKELPGVGTVREMHHVNQDPPDDPDSALQLALDADETRYSPWTWSMLRLYLVLACAYLCGCLNGYDGSLMGGLNGMKSYQEQFNMYASLQK